MAFAMGERLVLDYFTPALFPTGDNVNVSINGCVSHLASPLFFQHLQFSRQLAGLATVFFGLLKFVHNVHLSFCFVPLLEQGKYSFILQHVNSHFE